MCVCVCVCVCVVIVVVVVCLFVLCLVVILAVELTARKTSDRGGKEEGKQDIRILNISTYLPQSRPKYRQHFKMYD